MLTKIFYCLFLVVNIWFPLYRLDGRSRSWWKRISLSNVASQCMYRKRISILATVRFFSILDDGEVWSYKSFESSIMRNIASSKMAFIWISNLYVESMFLSSIYLCILLFYHHISCMQSSWFNEFNSFMPKQRIYFIWK